MVSATKKIIAKIRNLTGWLGWCAILVTIARAGEETVRYTMLNVAGEIGQADCHLLQFPDGTTVLIDAADGVDTPGAAVRNLQHLQIHRISLVVISHFHRDHYGRLLDILNSGIVVERVALNVPDKTAADREIPWGCNLSDVQSLLSDLTGRKIPYFTPKAGERILEIKSEGQTTMGIDVLCCYDGLHTPIGPTDVNDTSIIMRVFNGNTRVLFTGDLNHALGAYLAKSDIDLRADVLKAPHHGTDGTAPNEFYERVEAKAVLVPSPKALWESARSMRTRNYFIEHHVPCYVSGINGNVTIILGKDSYRIESER